MTKSSVAPTNQNVKSIWGKVILYLKTKKYITLQIACGDIVNVELVGKNFVINTEDQMVYNTITAPQNLQALKDAFKWLELDFEIIVNRLLRKDEQQAKDFEKLKILGIEFKKEGEL